MEVAEETRSKEGKWIVVEARSDFLITGEPAFCASGHTDVQLAGAVILGVNTSHMNREGAEVSGGQLPPLSLSLTHQLSSRGNKIVTR